MENHIFTERPSRGSYNLTKARLDLGRFGEDLAVKTIKKLGYKLITRNFRCSLGEIDLIANDHETLVFLEIKTRKGKSISYAKEAVNTKKKRQLSKVALAYIKSKKLHDRKARFDVVAISLDRGTTSIEVIKNAFDLAY